jgi:hypothetical protein
MLRVNGSRTCSGPSTSVRDQPPSCTMRTPNLAKVRSISGNCSGVEFFTSTQPPVMAPSARKVTISWKSSAKVKSPPPSSLHAVDHQARGAQPFDARAQHLHEGAELLHVRLAGGVHQHAAAFEASAAHST